MGVIKVLFLGDIVGKPGRTAVRQRLDWLRERYRPDVVIANGENASHGLGLSAKNAGELLGLGIDLLTTGNHVYKYRDLYSMLDREPRLLRPANFPPDAPGHGLGLIERAGVRLAVMNLQGRTYMNPIDCPFRKADQLLAELEEQAQQDGQARVDLILVDFHAEATSEKQALGWHLDGRVSALVGTHTHVQTNDARVLPGGTAYLTDAGMCGPRDSCLGMKTGPVLKRFLTAMPERFEPAGGPVVLQGALFHLDPTTKRAVGVELVNEETVV